MRLCHFHADGAAADDQQAIGPLAQVKEGFVGFIGHGVEPRDGRDKGRRAGGDDDAAGGDDVFPGLHFGRREKFAILSDHTHAQAFEPLLAVDGLDLGDDIGDVILGGGIVHLGALVGDAVLGGMGLGIGRLAAGNERLGGHTAEVEAIAAHLVTLQQDDARPHLHRARREGQAAGAGPDDQKISL